MMGSENKISVISNEAHAQNKFKKDTTEAYSDLIIVFAVSKKVAPRRTDAR